MYLVDLVICFFFKQKTAYEMRISDWSSDVCSSDLTRLRREVSTGAGRFHRQHAQHGGHAGRDQDRLHFPSPCRMGGAYPAEWGVPNPGRARGCSRPYFSTKARSNTYWTGTPLRGAAVQPRASRRLRPPIAPLCP